MNSKNRQLANNENAQVTFEQRVECEQQKQSLYDQKLLALEQRRKDLIDQQHILQQKITTVKQKISSISQNQNPILKQLRQYYKALKQELNSAMMEDQGDNIDIDNMTYEELIELGQSIGKVSKGLSSQKIESLQKVPSSSLSSFDTCSICRQNFGSEQQCIKLPCNHLFHRQCVQGWLQIQKVCPNCKAQIV